MVVRPPVKATAVGSNPTRAAGLVAGQVEILAHRYSRGLAAMAAPLQGDRRRFESFREYFPSWSGSVTAARHRGKVEDRVQFPAGPLDLTTDDTDGTDKLI